MARPGILIDVEERESLASLGLTHEQICLGISEATLRRRKQESERLGFAIERGRARGSAIISSALAANVRAQIFYLNAPGGWQHALAVAPAVTEHEALEELNRA